ncbi:MAG: phenylalanine--tRNA ligase subunit beta [Lachnospiraceae bacterium]|nr:phenylalanine--tRNA ligase subunit beta [Lachnospiraceae bacterium]
MNTALSWIKAYVPDLTCEDQEYMDAMTLSGTKVEGYSRRDKNLEKIVVGRIEKIERHPDADKLIVCQVDIGSGVIQIVTGASNVKEGDKVPVVLDGGRVAGGHDGGPLPEEGITIKAGKLRGVPSNGMMCSIEELGSDRNMYPEAPEFGIYIFDDDAEVGSDAVEALGLHDTVFEYEVTSNRVDCYSVIGIAREAAATFRKPFYAPQVRVTGNGGNVEDYIAVEVEDRELCPRYCARVCTNIQIGPSPKWMQRRLAASGIRPINNLVDITNYVMEEYGQPMHAYDLDTIAGHKIIVRRAREGDVFRTLDGQERNLDADVLMICDAEKEVGIAGIMGGENSMITDEVKTVLFEAASFNGANIRKSAKRVGLRTDASGKFEKGLDPHNAEAAINRACQLIEELGCGEVVDGMVDVCGEMKEEVVLPFEPDQYNKLLGTEVSTEEMLEIFQRIEVRYDQTAGTLTIPTFRQDLLHRCDIAEEVARFYGYDKIPLTLPTGEATTGKLPFKLRIEQKARDIAEYCGFSQGMCYSFESPKVFDRLLLDQDDPARAAISIANPLGEEFSVMRTLSLHGMLISLATNYNRRNKNVRLYELGNIYVPKALPLTELPDERMQFTLGMYGDGDFFTMKGVIEEFFDSIGLCGKLTYDPNAGRNFLHPGRQANVVYKGCVLGYLGEVHPEVCDNYDMKTRAYVAVLDMPSVMPHATFDRKYEGIAKYPAVMRDISMVVPKEIMVGQIEDVIAQRGGKILEDYQLFDIYEGDQIKAGYKSVAYSITFRAKDRTLEEADITAAMKKILNGLEGMGIELRS